MENAGKNEIKNFRNNSNTANKIEKVDEILIYSISYFWKNENLLFALFLMKEKQKKTYSIF